MFHLPHVGWVGTAGRRSLRPDLRLPLWRRSADDADGMGALAVGDRRMSAGGRGRDGVGWSWMELGLGGFRMADGKN